MFALGRTTLFNAFICSLNLSFHLDLHVVWRHLSYKDQIWGIVSQPESWRLYVKEDTGQVNE